MTSNLEHLKSGRVALHEDAVETEFTVYLSPLGGQQPNS